MHLRKTKSENPRQKPSSTQAGGCVFPHKVLLAHVKCSGSPKESYLTQDRVRIFQQLYAKPTELSDTACTVHLRPHFLQSQRVRISMPFRGCRDCQPQHLSFPAWESDERQLFGISQYIWSTIESWELNTFFLITTVNFFFLACTFLPSLFKT